jgi:hypothetical protein
MEINGKLVSFFVYPTVFQKRGVVVQEGLKYRDILNKHTHKYVSGNFVSGHQSLFSKANMVMLVELFGEERLLIAEMDYKPTLITGRCIGREYVLRYRPDTGGFEIKDEIKTVGVKADSTEIIDDGVE